MKLSTENYYKYHKKFYDDNYYKYHKKNYNDNYENSILFSWILSRSKTSNFNRKTIDQINHIQKYGFPPRPNELSGNRDDFQKEVINDIIKVLHKEYGISIDLVQQIIIGSIVNELLTDPRISKATMLLLVYRFIKSFKYKEK